jgi:hypothetical protein
MHQHRRMAYALSVIRSLFHRIGVWPTCAEANITVASAYEPFDHRAWSPSRCNMIRLWWSCSRCRVTNDSVVMHYLPLLHQTNSGGDGRLLHQRRVVRRWQNNQRPLHPTVTELHLVFTMYLLIQLGLNNLLNTHHTDIIITHHSSCPERRVLVIITMLNTSKTTVSTDELTQAVYR